MSLSSRSSSSGHSSSGVGSHQNSQPSRYFAQRHAPDDDFDFKYGRRRTGSVSVQDGAINLHIPCAFSYAYDVPVPPQIQREKSQPNLVKSSKKHGSTKPKSTTVPKESQSRPFYTSVKSGNLYQAKQLPAENSRKTHNKTSIVWDFHAGERVPYQAVDFGEELYEQAAKDLAQKLQQQQLSKKNTTGSTDQEDDCFDYSKPGINSSRNTTKALEKAMESLKHLPKEVDELLRKDKRFESIVMSKATRSLNVARNSKVFKDLIPIDVNPEVRTEAENIIQAELRRSIEATRPPSRSRDPEPRLINFQTNSYTRIRPAPVPPPSDPGHPISLEISSDLDSAASMTRLEQSSNRM